MDPRPTSASGVHACSSALRRHFIAFLYVGWEAEIRHKNAWLTGDVGPEVPRVARQQEGAAGHLVDVRNPFILRLDGRLDASVSMLTHVADAVGDPIDVLLDGRQHV